VSTPPAWIVPDDVARFLGEPLAALDADGNLTLSTAAWRAAVERRHPSYFDASIPPVYRPPDDIRMGTIRAAGMTFQARVATATGDEYVLWESLGANRAEVMRQLRWRLPVAV
jgi:hypothetical protein